MSDRVRILVYGRPASVRAKRRRGDWVLHRAHRADRNPNAFRLGWRVTHAPTGWALPYRYTLAEARRVLRAMYQTHPHCLAGCSANDSGAIAAHPDHESLAARWHKVIARIYAAERS